MPGSEKTGRSPVYRHWRTPNGMIHTLDESCTTAHDFFEQTANRIPNQYAFGARPYDPKTKVFGPYEWETYGQIQKRRANVGVGLVTIHEQLGITGKQYGVGIWCQNRPEWQIVDLACQSQALFSVSLYDTLGPDACEFIINHAGLTSVCASVSHIPTLLKLAPRCPTLKVVVSVDPLTDGEELAGTSKKSLLSSIAGQSGIKIFELKDLEAIGEKSPRPYNPPTPQDTVTINYTSGTTGNPKGVILTHANAVAAACASLCIVKQSSEDVICSYLPLAHIFQRVTEQGALWAGARIGYFHGSVIELIDDLKMLRPTAFTSVPRLFNRFGGAIKTQTIDAPGFKGTLSRHIVDTKLANLTQAPVGKQTTQHWFYDRIWGKKVSAALGLERAQSMITGSAPIDPQLQQFMRVVFGNHFIQGYGLTETYAIALAQLDGDFSAGNCGAVLPTSELCLQDVPDMEYFATDKPHARGELLIKGTTLFKEYYKNEAETTKAFTEDGWFKTGDICVIDEMGRFKIVDRVKNVLKLAQGEYVSPERIENVYLGNVSFLAMAYVHGDSTQANLVGIFGIQPDIFAGWLTQLLGKTIAQEDTKALEAAAQQPGVRKAVLAELAKAGKAAK